MPTDTPTATATSDPNASPTNTPTATATSDPNASPTNTPTATATSDPNASTDPIDKQAAEGPINRVITLTTDGRDLVQLGSTDGFGATERVTATRFIGDRAYVVTFLRRDPLFVVDLSDEANPRVLGELHIPGFSNYLYPLGSDHLFAIGSDATDDGVEQGLALQIFDVSDATNPTLAHRFVYDNFGFSPANVDHRAISFHAERNVVAFPFQNYSTGESTLEVFSVSADTGFVRLGGMGNALEITLEECLTSWGWDAESIAREVELAAAEPGLESEWLWQCNQGESFRRGLFRDDVVYGVSTGGVYAYDIDALDAGPLGEVSLPPQQWSYRSYGEDSKDPVDVGADGSLPTPPSIPMGTGAGGASGTPASAGQTNATSPDQAAEMIAADEEPADDAEDAPADQ
jgi:hypothetical protein